MDFKNFPNAQIRRLPAGQLMGFLPHARFNAFEHLVLKVPNNRDLVVISGKKLGIEKVSANDTVTYDGQSARVVALEKFVPVSAKEGAWNLVKLSAPLFGMMALVMVGMVGIAGRAVARITIPTAALGISASVGLVALIGAISGKKKIEQVAAFNPEKLSTAPAIEEPLQAKTPAVTP